VHDVTYTPHSDNRQPLRRKKIPLIITLPMRCPPQSVRGRENLFSHPQKRGHSTLQSIHVQSRSRIFSSSLCWGAAVSRHEGRAVLPSQTAGRWQFSWNSTRESPAKSHSSSDKCEKDTSIVWLLPVLIPVAIA